jgi:hypothetical protein
MIDMALHPWRMLHVITQWLCLRLIMPMELSARPEWIAPW